RNTVKLEAARFDGAVKFQSSPAQVCVEALDFADRDVFFDLHNADLLWQDEDDMFCANMPGVESADELRKRLVDKRWTPVKIEKAVAVYSEWSGNMFSEKGASFQGAYFDKPEQVQFLNVDLRTCQFANSNAGRVKFQNVQWGRRPTLLWASHRS